MSEFGYGEDNWPTLNNGEDFGVDDIVNAPIDHDILDIDRKPASTNNDDPGLVFAAREIARQTAEDVLSELDDANVAGLPDIMEKVREIDMLNGGGNLHIQDAGIAFRSEASMTEDPVEHARLSNLASLSSIITLIATARFVKQYGDVEEDDLFVRIIDKAEEHIGVLDITKHDYSVIKHLLDELKLP
jgi:hypothetical protein